MGMSQTVLIPSQPVDCLNFVSGKWVRPNGEPREIRSPYNGQVIGSVFDSTEADVSRAVEGAKRAFSEWGGTPIKERTQVMFRFREILLRDLDSIAHTISAENGKTLAESRAGLMKGIEVLEFAISLQNLDLGGRMEVSRGVHCSYQREPLGVVAGITPFNFPAMVPMWMIPIALTLGNSFVWKPSDKTPLTSLRIAQALTEAGLPDGALTVVQGGKTAVESLIDHPDVRAIGFVGSTAIARSVYRRGALHDKRVLALGGAKNHIILMPDADPELTARGVVDSFTGCAGQRCMAASVLLAVGNVEPLLHQIAEVAAQRKLGEDMGAVISKESLARLESAVARAKDEGARITLDGRAPAVQADYREGNWMAPTILDGVQAGSQSAVEELFGPVLSVIRCSNLSEAIQIENLNPYGNAASVFTRDGGVAERVARESRAGMIGVNIGVPVPREPFSFGGFFESKFGHGDITGHSSLGFWTDLKKVTTKWSIQRDQNWMS